MLAVAVLLKVLERFLFSVRNPSFFRMGAGSFPRCERGPPRFLRGSGERPELGFRKVA